MKKFLDLFKIKKSKVVEELTKEFDNNVDARKKANKKFNEDNAKERLKADAVFKMLMNQDFYFEIDDLMRHFDKKLNSNTKAQKCGFKVVRIPYFDASEANIRSLAKYLLKH